MQLTKKDVKVLKRIISSRDFKEIVDHCRASKTILGVLQDAFQENVLSQMLRFLCDTSEIHGLGDKFVREWLKRIQKIPCNLGKARCRIDAIFNWHLKTELDTHRYIDLVLLISNKTASTPFLVVGVETKIDSPESEKQIEDYQRALAQSFRHANYRVLLYLTPDGKANQTGKVDSGCPCYDISYNSIIAACNSVIKTRDWGADASEKRTRYLLRDFSQFLSGDIMKDKQRSQIDKLLKKLEKKEETKKALEILRGLSHHPTIRNFVYEELLPRIKEEFETVEVKWRYPPASARPHEFNFVHKDIETKLPKNSIFKIYYMLYSAKREPTLGDSLSVLLMAWSKSGKKFSSSFQKRFNSVLKKMPPSEGERQQWGRWMCLWASAEHRLRKFDFDEADDIFQLYKRTVDATKPTLLKFLSAG